MRHAIITPVQRGIIVPRKRRVLWARDIAGCQGHYHATNVTTDTAVLTGGTTPPAVTFSGNLNQPLTIRVEVNDVSGGTARGQAKFRWSLDGGGTFVESGVLTAASYALPGTGITVNFPVGTYAANNTYRSLVASLSDLSGNNRTTSLTATGAGLRYIAKSLGTNGGAGVRGDGVARALLADYVFATGALTVAVRFTLLGTPTSGQTPWLFTFPMAADKSAWFDIFFANVAGYQSINFSAKTGAGAQAQVGINPTLDTARHRLILTYNNGTPTSVGSWTAMLDGVAQTVLTSSNDSRAATNFGAIGAVVSTSNVIAAPMNCDVGELAVWNRVLSAREQARVDSYFAMST